jgi:C-terminal processing protease CtpA/Prc
MGLVSFERLVSLLPRLALLLICLELCIAGHAQTRDTAELVAADYLSGESIQKDLDSLKIWVESMHPAPFARCSEQDWNEAYLEASELYNGGGTSLAAAQVFARLTNVMKDSHTCVSLKALSDDLRELHGRLPFEITTIQNRIYIANDAVETIEKGTEIRGVNDQSARMVLGMALQLVPLEGDAPIARLRLAEKFWNDLGPMMIQSTPIDSIIIQLTDSDEKNFEQAVAINQSKSFLESRSDKSPINWEFIQRDGAEFAHLTITSFQSQHNRAFQRSLRRGFKRLNRLQDGDRKHRHGLILDIRGNAGGNVALMEMLLPYLTNSPVYLPHAVAIRQSAYTKSQYPRNQINWPIRKSSSLYELTRFSKALRSTPIGVTEEIPFDIPSQPHKRLQYLGEVALLMDGLSASASVAFASWFIQSGRGETFGEPSMGSASGTFGNPVKRVLPHTGLTVNIATAQYFSSASHVWDSKPILPDHPISWKASDIQNGNDPVFEAALQWLQNVQLQ